MAHNHSHEQDLSRAGETRLTVAFFITAAYMGAEVVGGIVFNSLALLADAGHMVSDAMALALAWFALRIGRRSPTDRHTYGFKRSEILAALINGLALWIIVGVIFYEAVHRFMNPPQVVGLGMLMVALIGLAVNLLMAVILFRTRGESLNLRGAFLHVVSDALGSVGAIAAAVVILTTGAFWADALASILIGMLILYSSWGLIRESVNVLMEGVPPGVDIKKVEEALVEHPGVCCLYDLHVWTVGSSRTALSAHVVVSEAEVGRTEVLRDLEKLLRERFNITHTTIQLESGHDMRRDADSPVCRGGTVCNSVRS
jgi:cobalt-zinc-cadmium efflux system protein